MPPVSSSAAVRRRYLIAAAALTCTASQSLAQVIVESKWIGGNGTWETVHRWSPVGIPDNNANQLFNVVIDVTGSNYVVETFGNHTVNSFRINSSFATVLLTKDLISTNGIQIDAGKLQLYGGGIKGNVSGAGSLELNGSILNNVTLNLNASIGAREVVNIVQNNLTLSNVNITFAAFNDGAPLDPTSLSFAGKQSILGTGNIIFDNPDACLTPSENGTLTFTPGITIKTGLSGGIIGAGPGIPDVVAGGKVINQGTISAETAGKTLSIYADWRNDGVLRLTAGTLRLGGNFTTADVGSITRTGGTLEIQGIFDNTGIDSNFDQLFSGDVQLAGGTLKGGIVRATNLTLASGIGGFGKLHDLTFAGSLTALGPGDNGAEFQNLTLDGASLSVGGRVNFKLPTDTLAGSGTMTIDKLPTQGTGATGLIYAQNFTIGSGVTIQTGTASADIRSYNYSIVNNGILLAKDSKFFVVGSTLSQIGPGSFINNGLLKATSGGSLVLEGNIPVGGLGTFDSTGGAVVINATLSNQNNTLALNGVGNVLTLNGSIKGGTISASNGAFLKSAAVTTSKLIDVTLDTDLNLTDRATLTLTNTSLLPGRTVTLNASTLAATDGRFVGGAKLQFTGAYGELAAPRAGSASATAMLIGPGISINIPTAGSFNLTGLSSTPAGLLVNQGSIHATSTSTILVANAFSAIENFGDIKIQNGSNRLSGINNNPGASVSFENGSTAVYYVRNSGSLAITGGTVALTGATSPADLGVYTHANGALISVAGAFDNTNNLIPLSVAKPWALGFNSSAFTANGTLSNGVLLSSDGTHLPILGGNMTVSNVRMTPTPEEAASGLSSPDIDIVGPSTVTFTGGLPIVGRTLSVTAGPSAVRLPFANSLPVGNIVLNGPASNAVATLSNLTPANTKLTNPAGATIRTDAGFGAISASISGFINTGQIIAGGNLANPASLAISVANFSNPGTLSALPGGTITLTQPFSASLTFTDITGGTRVGSSFNNATLASGNWIADNGTITFTNVTFAKNSANVTLRGTGAITGFNITENTSLLTLVDKSLTLPSLSNSGDLFALGNSILTITNALTLSPSSDLTLDLAGGAKLVSSTSIALDGALHLNLSNAAIGQQFILLTAPSITGQFSALDVPTINGQPGAVLFYSSTSVSVTIVPEPSALLITLPAALLLTRRRR